MKNIIFVYIFFILPIVNVKSQQQFNTGSGYINSLKTDYLPSVDAAQITEYGLPDIDLYSGKAQVNIPLPSIEHNGILLTPTFNHNTQGVTVADAAGWVGQNWSLNYGGAINRVREGIEDEIMSDDCLVKKGFFQYTQSTNIPACPLSLEEQFWDTEPDIFVFNFFGISGRFFIDLHGNWHVQSDTEVKVEFDINNMSNYSSPPFNHVPGYNNHNFSPTIAGFILIDENGYKYEFGYDNEAIEYSLPFQAQTLWNPLTGDFGPPQQPIGPTPNPPLPPALWMASTWHLSSVKDMNNNLIFDYSYSSDGFTARLHTSNSGGESLSCNGGSAYTTNLSTKYLIAGTLIKPTYLNEIVCSNGKRIEFEAGHSIRLNYKIGLDPTFLQNNPFCSPTVQELPYPYIQTFIQGNCNGTRHPTQDNPELGFSWRQLNKIKYYHNNNLQYYYSLIYNNNPTERLFLEEIELYDANSSHINEHKFYYNNISDLPDYLSDKVDHFGYFNNSVSNFSNLGINSGNYWTILAAISNNDLYYNARNSNLSYALKGSLSKIKLPTGGFKIFEYELHDYKSVVSDDGQNIQTISGNENIGGLRIQRIALEDDNHGILSERTFVYEKIQNGQMVSSGILARKPKYTWENINRYQVFNTNNPNSNVGFTQSFISTANLFPLGALMSPPITYSSVKEMLSDGSSILHEFTSHYEYLDDYPDFWTIPNNAIGNSIGPYFKLNSRDFLRGRIKKKKYFNANNDIIKEMETSYRDISGLPDVNRDHQAVPGGSVQTALCNGVHVWFGGYYSLYAFDFYKTEIKETDYYYNNNSLLGSIEKKTTYNNDVYKLNWNEYTLLESESIINSDNKTHLTKYQYPLSSGVTNYLQTSFSTQHRIKDLLKTEYYVDNVLIDGYETFYSNFTGTPMPINERRYEYTWDVSGNGHGSWKTKKHIASYDMSVLKPTSIEINGWSPATFTWTSSGKLKNLAYLNHSLSYSYSSVNDSPITFTDIDGQVINYEYDNLQRLKWIKERNDNRKTEYIYSFLPNKIETKKYFSDQNNQHMIEEFDNIGRLFKTTDLNSNAVVERTYDPLGRLHTESDAEGELTTFTYYSDPLNRIKEKIDPLGFTYLYEYKEAGMNYKNTIIDPDGLKSIVFTDFLGRKVKSENGINGSLATTDYEYDAKSRLTKIIPPDATINDSGLIYEFNYDGSDNVIRRKFPDKNEEILQYDIRNLETAFQDQNIIDNGKGWLSKTYDQYGRTLTTGFGQNPGAPTDILISYFYDGNGTGQQSNPIYNGKKDKSIVNVLNGFNKGSSNLTTTFSFDSYGRVSNEIVSGISDYSEQYGYTYFMDDQINKIIHTAHGNISEEINYYDSSLRLNRTDFKINGNTKITSDNILYNKRNQIVSKDLNQSTYPIALSYNDNSWLSSITSSNFNFNLNYNAPQYQHSTSRANGSISESTWNTPNVNMGYSYHYDELNRLISADSFTGDEFGLACTYKDKRGNLDIILRLEPDGAYVKSRSQMNLNYIEGTNKINHICDPNCAENCVYDFHVSNLNLATGSYGVTNLLTSNATISNIDVSFISENEIELQSGFEFDGAGYDFEAKIDNCNVHNNQTNQFAYQYDGNGNIIFDPLKVLDFKYNHHNLPYEVTDGMGNNILWTYTAEGKKLRKTSSDNGNNETTTYLNNKHFKGPSFDLSLINFPDGHIDVQAGSLNWRYILRDHLGNTRVILDESNNILEEHHYYPFGLEMNGSWTSSNSVVGNDYLYNGKERVDELNLGLYEYGARFYDPNIGRFTGVDPISDKFAHVSTYNYAENEPVANIDLWGLQKFSKVKNNGKRLDSPKDLVSRKMATNALQGFKVMGAELGAVVSNIIAGITPNTTEGTVEKRGGMAGSAENGSSQDNRVNEAAESIELDEFTTLGPKAKMGPVATGARVASKIESKSGVVEHLLSEEGTEKLPSTSKTTNDSLFCRSCNNLEDSSHIDRVHGEGTFEKRKNNE